MVCRWAVGLALAATLGACVHTPPAIPQAPAVVTPEDREPAAQADDQLKQAMTEGLHIVVSKAERALTVYEADEVIARYRMALGFQPRGHKLREGDGRTPEGRYAVAVKNPNSRFFLSVGLNYPTPPDASRAYNAGRITWAEYRAIAEAFDEDAVPPWNTALGGEIFIHGHGATRDWTLGCIALENADMQALYELVEVGTPVTILP